MTYFLKVSRPGLWFITIWLYLLPTSQQNEIWSSWEFWYGFFYICFPLNFLIYGWNDTVDYETDHINIRKNSFWFGARSSKEQLSQLWKPIFISQLLTVPLLFWIAGSSFLILYCLILFCNLLYNHPTYGMRDHPPWDMVSQIAYLLIVPLSISINSLESLPWQTYVYIFLFSVQSHLMGEIMDIMPDREAGRSTTATLLGREKCKALVLFLMLLEILILYFVFEDLVLSGLMVFGFFWVLLDLVIFFKGNNYSLTQMKLFAFGSNGISFTSMLYVWYTGALLHV